MDQRRLLLVLEYDGTDFEGFQIQKKGRTVQGELEKALQKITGEKVRIVGAGRTDAGVHATGQAVHADTSWNKSLSVFQRALNAVLPDDLAVRSVREVHPSFSARYDAVSRTYRYTILNRPDRSPLNRRYALLVNREVNVDLMDRAAKALIGKHDFGAFGRPPHGTNSIREMLRAGVSRKGDRVVVELEAQAFLYRMARRIVGTLLAVGSGGMSLEAFGEVLARTRKSEPPVPPHGLCLVNVKYDLSTPPSAERNELSECPVGNEADLSE